MGLTVTPSPRSDRNHTALGAVGNGMVIETGTLAFDSAYVTGGEPVTFSIPAANIVGVFMEPYGGRLYTYDKSAETILAYFSKGGTASGVFTEISSTCDLSAMSNVPYVVFGFA